MAYELPLLMSPQDAKILADVIRAARNIRGTGGMRVHLVPGSGVTIASTAIDRAQPSSTPKPETVESHFYLLWVIQEKEDYLKCTPDGEMGEVEVDGDNINVPAETNVVNVLKPRHLRGKINMIVYAENTQVEQIFLIYPTYQAVLNTEKTQQSSRPTLWAMPYNGNEVDDDGQPIVWIDSNLTQTLLSDPFQQLGRTWVTEGPGINEWGM